MSWDLPNQKGTLETVDTNTFNLIDLYCSMRQYTAGRNEFKDRQFISFSLLINVNVTEDTACCLEIHTHAKYSSVNNLPIIDTLLYLQSLL